MSINLEMSDSGSILRHESEIQDEYIATTSESFQEFAHPDDVAAMLAEMAQASKEAEYLRAHQWSPAAIKHLQDTQPVFPTPNQFTAPVPGLPQYHQMDTNQYYSTLEGPSWSHPAQGTSTASHATATNALLSPASDPNATMTLSDGSDLEASSPASNETMPASGSSRVLGKRKAWQTEDSSSSSSPPPCKRGGYHQDDDDDEEDDDEIKDGKFGAYSLATASAVVMAMPVHDPKPVDIRNRRTHDPDGNLLKTRRFGAMELDDSYPKRRVAVGRGLPTGMTCVQACNWGDQPCGLFVEINKVRITQHLFFWHGVKPEEKTLCKFEDCPKPGKMISLGRHIENVHYTTALECAYCDKQRSRTDSSERHLKSCKVYRVSKASAKKAGRRFSPKEPEKLVYGYIVPACNAT